MTKRDEIRAWFHHFNPVFDWKSDEHRLAQATVGPLPEGDSYEVIIRLPDVENPLPLGGPIILDYREVRP